MVKSKKINAPYESGRLPDYWRHLENRDRLLAQRLKDVGLPLDGFFILTKTSGSYYGSAYKDFTVMSLGVLLGPVDEIDFNNLKGIVHVGDGGLIYSKVRFLQHLHRQGIIDLSRTQALRVRETQLAWRVWYMDVKREGMDSCIRYIWKQESNLAFVTIENINSDLQHSILKNGLGNATNSVITQLERLLPGLKLIEIEETKKGRHLGSGNLDNVDDDDLIDIYAYLWAKHQHDNLKAPNQYDLAGWLGVDRTTVWRRLKDGMPWAEIKKKGKERAKTIPLEKLQEALKP